MKYKIWSIQHGQWWKPKSLGYTDSFIEAGVYEEEEARSILKSANISLGYYPYEEKRKDFHIPMEALVPVED